MFDIPMQVSDHIDIPLWLAVIFYAIKTLVASINSFSRAINESVQDHIKSQVKISETQTKILERLNDITALLSKHEKSTEHGFRRIEDKISMMDLISTRGVD